jgi:hypothetical protein
MKYLEGQGWDPGFALRQGAKVRPIFPRCSEGEVGSS